MALTIEQQNFVKELATLAWGTGGSSERAAGGKGNMGLIYGQDGTAHIIKFNTHSSQEKSAQRAALAGSLSQEISGASDALRGELQKLARAAGLDSAAVDQLLNVEGKPLLTRKIVASFVSQIVDTVEDFRDVNIWDYAQASVAEFHLKSAGNMDFEKVAHPDADHEKFYRLVTGLNAAPAEEVPVPEVAKEVPAPVHEAPVPVKAAPVEVHEAPVEVHEAPVPEKAAPVVLKELPAAEDDIAVNEGASLAAKTFDFFVKGCEYVESRNKDVKAFLQNARASAAKRGAAQPDVHDFLSIEGLNTRNGGVYRLLLQAGCPKNMILDPRNQNFVVNVAKLLPEAGAMSLEAFIAALREKAKAAGVLAIAGKTDDELKLSLVKTAIDRAPKFLANAKYHLGVFGGVEGFSYTREGGDYTSRIEPNRELLSRYSCPAEERNGGTLVGLSVSSLTVKGPKGERTLAKVNRFGSLMSAKDEDNVANYKALAVQTFLESPRLRARVQEGANEVEVPVYRLDMAPENGKFKLPQAEKLPTTITFKDTDGRKKTVTLKPRIHYMQLPVDSFETLMKKYMVAENGRAKWVGAPEPGVDTVLEADHVKALHQSIADLVQEAETAAPGLDETTRAEVKALADQLKAYGAYLKGEYVDKGASIKYSKTIGHEMFRAGARLALLASKLGLVASINCNMGRDRTGSMDNEIKMLALQLAEGKALAPIRQADEEGDQDVALRSELAVKNGENDLARQIFLQAGPINTNQSHGIMNFNVLFNPNVLERN